MKEILFLRWEIKMKNERGDILLLAGNRKTIQRNLQKPHGVCCRWWRLGRCDFEEHTGVRCRYKHTKVYDPNFHSKRGERRGSFEGVKLGRRERRDMVF